MTELRSLGEMTRSTDPEIERIKNYIERGPTGRFDLDNELRFIRSQKEITRDMFEFEYLDATRYQTEMMTLSARELKLRCFMSEMFERCWL